MINLTVGRKVKRETSPAIYKFTPSHAPIRCSAKKMTNQQLSANQDSKANTLRPQLPAAPVIRVKPKQPQTLLLRQPKLDKGQFYIHIEGDNYFTPTVVTNSLVLN